MTIMIQNNNITGAAGLNAIHLAPQELAAAG
jgi:hypothetical protein